MRMVCLGLNYRTAPVEIRERFAVPSHRLQDEGRRLYSLSHVEQCVVLSTCNRMEIYYWSENPTQAQEHILAHFLGDGREDIDITSYFYSYMGADALVHLCRVLSGLDSMVLGETEIFGQVKTAYQMALEAGVTATCANKTFQKAFSIGKKVRTGSLIHAGATSVGSVAVELAEQIFGNLSGTRVLILGAGEMSRVTGRALHARGAEGIYVANRSFDRAVELASSIGGQAIRYDSWAEYLKDIDVVVAATAAPHCIITRETLLPLRVARKYRSLFLIDISVPRNISPDVADIDEVYLYDIDTLTQLADEAKRNREQEVARCEVIIRDNITKYFPDSSLYEQ